MCKASKYLNELESLTARINADFELLNRKQSEIDKILSEKYHELENANFNACEGYYHAKQLQQVLRQRRVIKGEMARMNILHNSLKQLGVPKTINKAKMSIENSNKSGEKFIGSWIDSYSIDEILH
jgi:hypothetical protein